MSVDLLPPPGEFRTTAEIRDARYAQDLRRRRRRMLMWSAPLLLLALLVALKLLSAVVINAAGTSAYEDAAHNTAADRFELLADVVNVVEPWKAHFNTGTAVYASGDFFNATTDLEIALELVPRSPDGEPPAGPECDVRTNYSLALEGLGDEALAAGDPAMANNYLTQAQTMLAECGQSNEQAEEAEERQEQSQQEAQEQQEQQEGEEGDGGEQEQPTDGESGEQDPSASPTDGEGGEESATPTDGESATPTDGGSGDQATETPTEGEDGGESRDPREEELESRNSEAQESRDAQEQESGGGDGSGQNW